MDYFRQAPGNLAVKALITWYVIMCPCVSSTLAQSHSIRFELPRFSSPQTLLRRFPVQRTNARVAYGEDSISIHTLALRLSLFQSVQDSLLYGIGCSHWLCLNTNPSFSSVQHHPSQDASL
jgi:hypothetical protein